MDDPRTVGRCPILHKGPTNWQILCKIQRCILRHLKVRFSSNWLIKKISWLFFFPANAPHTITLPPPLWRFLKVGERVRLYCQRIVKPSDPSKLNFFSSFHTISDHWWTLRSLLSNVYLTLFFLFFVFIAGTAKTFLYFSDGSSDR